MLVNFTKMQGLGNDFMVVDNTKNKISFNSEQISALANRNFGVGFDQLLLVEKSTTKKVDFRYVIYNADGSEANQCGNGARCFMLFLITKGLTNKKQIKIETKNSLIEIFVNDDKTIKVDMGKPSFNPLDIPLNLEKAKTYKIAGYEVGALSMGNPHCVMLVDNLDEINIKTIALKIQKSKLLPKQANINFMQILDPKNIKMRTFEIGAGETLACGSGACAAVVYGIQNDILDSKVNVGLKGGDALVEYTKNKNVFLSGPAKSVFSGQVQI
jgi:diaminopimelate epimerase